jgi:hypothetical protein
MPCRLRSANLQGISVIAHRHVARCRRRSAPPAPHPSDITGAYTHPSRLASGRTSSTRNRVATTACRPPPARQTFTKLSMFPSLRRVRCSEPDGRVGLQRPGGGRFAGPSRSPSLSWWLLRVYGGVEGWACVGRGWSFVGSLDGSRITGLRPRSRRALRVLGRLWVWEGGLGSPLIDMPCEGLLSIS